MTTTLLSDRNIPLVYQGGSRIDAITVEHYPKWYSLYVVTTSGVVYKLGDYEGLEKIASELGTYAIGDHTFNPHVVWEYTERHGYDVDWASYEMVVGRWEIQQMNNY